MDPMILKNVRIAGGVVHAVDIEIGDGVVTAIDRSVDGDASTARSAMPGFVDIHNHGAVGVDVNSASADDLVRLSEFLSKNGVTAWLPTLVPGSDENYQRTIAAIDELMERQHDLPIAQAVGVHYEGVFASEQMCGALKPQFFKKFTGTELSELPRLRKGVHMMTFAPEIEGGIELAAEMNQQGWVASIGHTRASIEILDKALANGTRHLTHFFNAMTGLHHRDVGVVGWALANDRVSFDVIADGVHVHPLALKAACRAKLPDRVSLISDSIAPTGLGDGKFEVWGETIEVVAGRTQNARGSIAGSVITMIDAVQKMRSVGFSISEVSRMASMNPAELLGLNETSGSIEVGKRADIVVFGPDDRIQEVFICGRPVRM
jgi:N-acetylglucosamine-6-phosphate deacetylase